MALGIVGDVQNKQDADGKTSVTKANTWFTHAHYIEGRARLLYK